MATTLPTPLQVPTSKERKYDRQLRLWAASGQKALEEAHILLINSGTGLVGIETLKNLILPGVGHFTILDDATVQEEDLGINFFLEEESLGKSRAEQCCKLLNELNPDVTGNYISEPIETLLSQTDALPDALEKYSLVLVTSPIKPDAFKAVCKYTQDHSIPLFYIHCVGFYSCFSIQLPPTFPIVDTHPDPASTQDLRLLDPWPELAAEAAKYKDLDPLNDHDHGHVPYIILLLHYLEIWRSEHDGRAPENYKEKTAFKDMVKAGARQNSAEGSEENYEEAIAAVLKTINKPSLPSTLRELFEMEECKNPTKDSARFYLIANAISKFYNTNKALPLPGSVPDMKSESHTYVSLQSLYRARSASDIASVISYVRSLEHSVGRLTPISEKEIEAFCKNAAYVKVIHGKPLHPIQAGQREFQLGDDVKMYMMELMNDEEENSCFPTFIAFIAYDVFYAETGRPPTTKDSAKLFPILSSMLSNIPVFTLLTDDDRDSLLPRLQNVLLEIGRAKGGELHNIAALTGGIVSQEAIKVITEQYVPVDNTCVFDGIKSRSQVFRI
ncbi:MAG: hypothetical protein M1834_007582 [Cirrosporium novae-zelandiae]|nr:MAG: hypothetical protein M1834_007582 [Cirrosporium novae-zelandiae]